MKRLNTEASRKIEWMSLWCACLVVGMHIGLLWSPGLLNKFLLDYVASGYSSMAVPFFFVVSGYFLSRHFCEKEWYGRELKKRLLSLGVPFVVWTVITFAIKSHPNISGGLFLRGDNGGLDLGNLLILLGVKWDAWPYVHSLWYLRSLLIFVVLSPLLGWMLRRYGIVVLMFAMVLELAMSILPDPLSGGLSGCLYNFLSVRGLLFFMIGMNLTQMHGRLCQNYVAAYACGVVGVMILVVRNIVLMSVPWSRILTSLSIPFFMLFTWTIMPSRPLPALLTHVSFPVYLIHPIIVSVLNMVFRYLGLPVSLLPVVVWLFTIPICIMCAHGLARFCPRFSQVAFGGRNGCNTRTRRV